jgi:hypothetical protein
MIGSIFALYSVDFEKTNNNQQFYKPTKEGDHVGLLSLFLHYVNKNK